MPSTQADLLLAELVAIQSAGETCTVVVTEAGREQRIHFEGGTLVHAEEPASNVGLGKLLVAEGKLTPEQLEGLLATVARAEAGASMRLGDAAIAQGLLSRKELGLALLADVRATVVDVLTWEAPTFAVVPSDRPAGPARARFPTSIEPLVLSAFRKLPRARLAELVAPLARLAPPILLEPADAMQALFRTRIEENEALGSVIREGGAQALTDMMKGRRGPQDGLPFVAALAAVGSLTWPGGPPSLRTNPPARLVVPRSARRDRVSRDAKKKAVRSFAPKAESTVRWVLPDEAERATSEPAASASSKLAAERAFLVGKAHLDLGNVAYAKAEFWRAHQLDPSMAEYELYLGWLTLRGDERRAAELESIAIRAKRQAPELGFASYVLSHLALLRGDVDRAEAEQQRAARLGVRDATPFPKSIGFDRQVTGVDESPFGQVDAKIRVARGRKLLSPARARRARTGAEAGQRARAHGAPQTLRYGSPTVGAARPQAEIVRISAAGEPEEPAAVTLPSTVLSVPPEAPPAVSVISQVSPAPQGAQAAQVAPTGASASQIAQAVEAPSSQTTPTVPPAAREEAPSPRRWPFVVLGGLLAIGGIVLARTCLGDAQEANRAQAPSALPSAQPLPSTEPSSSTQTTRTEPAPDAALGASVVDASDSDHDAGALADAAGDARASSVTGSKLTGELVVEGAPAGRRIFVGKHAVGETPSVVVAPCGKRQVMVGSRGTPRIVDIPCGGRVTIKP